MCYAAFFYVSFFVNEHGTKVLAVLMILLKTIVKTNLFKHSKNLKFIWPFQYEILGRESGDFLTRVYNLSKANNFAFKNCN